MSGPGPVLRPDPTTLLSSFRGAWCRFKETSQTTINTRPAAPLAGRQWGPSLKDLGEARHLSVIPHWNDLRFSFGCLQDAAPLGIIPTWNGSSGSPTGCLEQDIQDAAPLDSDGHEEDSSDEESSGEESGNSDTDGDDKVDEVEQAEWQIEADEEIRQWDGNTSD